MHFFYVLYSLKDHKLYKGYSSDIGKRFIKHINGGTPSTKHRRPLILIYVEAFYNKADALARERWAKSPSGGPELIRLLHAKQLLCSDNNILCN
jgi:putative endonuclease